MAKAKEKKALEKTGWVSSFTLVGEAKVREESFQIDEKAQKSDWIYNIMNIGIDCGEKHGTVYASLSGGYGAERDNVCYVHGKDEDGKDDFKNRFTIDWEDRFDESILEDVGDMCFLTVGLEKDKNDKVFYKKFLAPYDAILYVQEHLETGMVVNVKGTLKYSMYNGKVSVNKEINSIVLSSKADHPSKYYARFNQTMLLTKDSVGELDKSTGVLPIYAKVLDYVKEYKGREVKTFIPYNKAFEYECDLSKPELVQKAIDKLFKVKKGVTEITFQGDFIAGGATVTATEDDIPDDIKELIALEIYTLEEALEKCSVNSGRELRMVLRKPNIKLVETDGNMHPVVQKVEQKYSEEDLILDFMYEDEEENADEEVENDLDETPFDEDESSDDDSWLQNI